MSGLATQPNAMHISGSAMPAPSFDVASDTGVAYDASTEGSVCSDADDIGRVEGDTGTLIQSSASLRWEYKSSYAAANSNDCWRNASSGKYGMLTDGSITVKHAFIVGRFKEFSDSTFDDYNYLLMSDGTNGYPGCLGHSGTANLYNTTGSIYEVSVNDAALSNVVLPLGLSVIHITFATPVTSVFSLGYLPTYGGRGWVGLFTRLLTYPSAITAEQATSVVNTEKTRWGIT